MASNLFDWSLFQFQCFVLIMMRVAPILFMMPLLSSTALPNLLKISFTLAVSLLLLPVVKIDVRYFPSDPYLFGTFMAAELMIGFILGLSVKLIFAGVQLAGEFAGYQMGLAMANILDPESGMDTTLIAQFYYLVGLLVFSSHRRPSLVHPGLVPEFFGPFPGRDPSASRDCTSTCSIFPERCLSSPSNWGRPSWRL